MDLFDRGIISRKDTGGLELRWGDAEAIEILMQQIASCRGLGKILAGGVRRAAKVFGKKAEKYAYHVKGVEIYGADPRGSIATMRCPTRGPGGAIPGRPPATEYRRQETGILDPHTASTHY